MWASMTRQQESTKLLTRTKKPGGGKRSSRRPGSPGVESVTKHLICQACEHGWLERRRRNHEITNGNYTRPPARDVGLLHSCCGSKPSAANSAMWSESAVDDQE